MTGRKTDRHKNLMFPFRPGEDQLAWLRQHAADTARPMNAILRQALAEYRARAERQNRS
jgi:hypothetical protein